MNLDSYRNDYNRWEKTSGEINPDPVIQFKNWMDEALLSDEKEPTAMSLITFGTDGFPHSRIVLLKFFDKNGFVFFTNYHSTKGKEITKNSAVTLHFFWPVLQRQICIAGFCSKISRKLSEKYFLSRPRESCISAWASEQSMEIPSREYLEKRFEEFSQQFQNQTISLPPFWGGYRVVPEKFEFWEGRINRLHERLLYEKSEKGWIIRRLAP